MGTLGLLGGPASQKKQGLKCVQREEEKVNRPGPGSAVNAHRCPKRLHDVVPPPLIELSLHCFCLL